MKEIKGLRESKTQKRLNELVGIIEDLHKFNVLTYQANRVKELYKLIVDQATDIMNTKIGSLMLYNSHKNRLEIVASRGLSKKVVKTTSLIPGEGIAGRVFVEGEPIFCEDIEKDKRFKKKSHVKYYSKSFISVPLKVRNKVIGVLNINNKKSRQPFTIEEMKILTVIADEAAMTIENMQLLKRIEEAYIESIQTLAKVVDERMPSTRGHSRRVAHIAFEFGKELDLDKKFLFVLRNAALIHDIGKIGIPDKILLKPSKLSQKERKVIQKHPAIGETVISRAEFFREFVPIVAFHHEWWNGKGYPLGLKGEQIPLGARIIAICDAWDAMTSSRPYRATLSKQEAIKELKKYAGIQFDPQLVKVFLKFIQKKLIR